MNLDVVLPLAKRDLERFRILQRSMRAFLTLPGTWWVIVPDRDWALLSEAIADDCFVVVPESQVSPELANAGNVSGWFKQQLIKLAMAQHVQSDYYLTLDADVIIARPVDSSDFFSQGRANCHRYPGKAHRRWYRWAERVLTLPRSGWVHGVTPVVLSREGVRLLASYLNTLSPRPNRWWHKATVPMALALGIRRRLRMPPQADGFASGRWRTILLSSEPWTEYSLYFTFLEATSEFDRFHSHSDNSLYGPSVWRRNNFDQWDPVKSGAPKQPFLIVQSNTGIPAKSVAERVERLFAA